MAGEYLVSPEDEAVRLLDINTGHIFYRWPYNFLRKFGLVEVKHLLIPRNVETISFKPHQLTFISDQMHDFEALVKFFGRIYSFSLLLQLDEKKATKPNSQKHSFKMCACDCRGDSE